MRLSCPNCDAQYEVPDEVVPTAGRDVQCSSCGKTWFQFHPDHPPAEVPQEVAAELSPTEPAPDDEVSPAPPPEPAKTAEPQRRQLDPEVADILRQEAEVEFEARRRRQAQTLESQPDLGLEEGEKPKAPPPAPPQEEQARTTDASARVAQMRGEPAVTPEEAVAAAAAISSRRELLPDIDEINSTLRSGNTTPHAVDAETRAELGAGGAPKRKSGFRRGFMLVLFIFVLMALVYIFADQIGEAIPAIKINLAIYVEWVDGLRMSLDSRLKSMVGTLDSIANETDG